jgi:arylsulfatase A-like enzyme
MSMTTTALPTLTRRGLLAASGAALAALTRHLRGATPKSRPNILLVHTDDQAQWAMGAYGNRDIHTPNMDALARQGALFTRAFVSTPVCSPARATLMTGLDSIQHGIKDWIHPKKDTVGLELKFITFPELLKDAGYVTGYMGKWHLGKEPRFHPRRRRFDAFTGFINGGNRPKDPVLEINGETSKREGWLVDMLTDAALDFLSANRSKPFFCMVSYRDPHGPWQPVQPQDAAPYRGKELKLFKGSEANPKKAERQLRAYYACCTAVDRNLGRLLAKLDELSIANDTMVIFTGDNGYMIGQHGLSSKGNAHRLGPPGGCRPNMFDPAILVPLAVRWPGVVKPGMRIDDMVGQIDFFATLCDVAGVPQAKRPATESVSLLPLLQGRRMAGRDAFFGSYDQYQYEPAANLRMIRTERWKLVRNFADGKDELYDLAADPGELANLASDPKARQMRDDLIKRLVAWQRRLRDPILELDKSGR